MATFARHDPNITLSRTNDPSSFAYETARQRWPKILDQAVAEVRATVQLNQGLSSSDMTAADEIEHRFNSLKRYIAENAPLLPLPDDGGLDIAGYNGELETLNRPTWLSAPWLYTECYMYRLIRIFFTTSTPFWQSFDIFRTDKRKALVGSKKGAIELVKHFREILAATGRGEVHDEETRRAIFEEMVQISLWGNATDLSLLTSLSVEQLESRQGKAARDESRANVLVDDTSQVEDLLQKQRSSRAEAVIHIVLDNAGFELLADLVFAGYLLESGYASKIVLHGKCMPWFVSDVNSEDLKDLVDGFASGITFSDIGDADKEELKAVGKYWQDLFKTEKMRFVAEPFWTTAHAFGRLADVDQTLYNQLLDATLVVYKGDLNYRKLTYDGMWPKTTPFSKAIGPLAEKQAGKGTRTLVLRTCKADVGVGLKEGVEETLPKDWTRTGKYALVSYWDGKS